MNRYITTTLLVILFLCNSCKSDYDLTENIIEDIFPQLQDSLKIDYINFKLIPPPKYDKDSIFIGIDSVQFQKNKIIHKHILDSIKKANPKILISMNDTVKLSFTTSLKKDLISDRILYDSIFKESFRFPNKKYPYDPINYKTIDMEEFQFVSSDQLIETYESHPKIWHGINDRLFGGAIHIRGILLNEEKDYGVLELSRLIVALDGINYMVAIEKNDDTWQITEVKNRWW